MVCASVIPSKHKTLRIHLNRAHGLELLPGCPDCFYFRGRWDDVKKHCLQRHKLDINRETGAQGCAWGVTSVDKSRTKPTYAFVQETDVCTYPKEGETLSGLQEKFRQQGREYAEVQESPPRSRSAPQPSTSQEKRKRQEKPHKSLSPKRRRKRSPVPSHSSQPIMPRKSPRTRPQSSRREDKPPQSSRREDKPPQSSKSVETTRPRTVVTPKGKGRGKSSQTKTVTVQVETKVTEPQPSTSTISLSSTSSRDIQVTPIKLRLRQESSPRVSTPIAEYKTSYELFEKTLTHTPTTPGSSVLDLSAVSSRTTRSREEKRRHLESVAQRLGSSSLASTTMETVSDLNESDRIIRIPVLDETEPEVSASPLKVSPERQEETEAAQQEHVVDQVQAAVVVDREQTAVVVDREQTATVQDSSSTVLLRPVPPSESVSTQTDVTVFEDETLLVIPRGGGRLQLRNF